MTSNITSDKLAPSAGPFSQAIRSEGFIFLSGQIGVDPETDRLVEGGIERQAEQLFANLRAVLEAAGGISPMSSGPASI